MEANKVNSLTVIKHDGQLVTDSREVATMVEKDHAHLLRDIKGYVDILTQSNFGFSEFFIPSTYQDSTGRTLPCYLLTRKGCDMVANKMTGEKGVLFTATYVTKFDEMEKALSSKLTTPIEALLQAVKILNEQDKKLRCLEERVTVANHRIDTLDATDAIGDPQQRLNAMIRKYAFINGYTFSKAWSDFKQSFNTAFHTNLEMRRLNYMDKHNLKKLSLPQYLTQSCLILDALRVADKLLNPGEDGGESVG